LNKKRETGFWVFLRVNDISHGRIIENEKSNCVAVDGSSNETAWIVLLSNDKTEIVIELRDGD
jgi:hypothetical protein